MGATATSSCKWLVLSGQARANSFSLCNELLLSLPNTLSSRICRYPAQDRQMQSHGHLVPHNQALNLYLGPVVCPKLLSTGE